mmetsp:Transcript_66405/g.158401  ORF Transcript_66405/g.158401 Transcript_66405/m.158401 type:complete len:278 (-) Transcript_66405:353-1186(-)
MPLLRGLFADERREGNERFSDQVVGTDHVLVPHLHFQHVVDVCNDKVELLLPLRVQLLLDHLGFALLATHLDDGVGIAGAAGVHCCKTSRRSHLDRKNRGGCSVGGGVFGLFRSLLGFFDRLVDRRQGQEHLGVEGWLFRMGELEPFGALPRDLPRVDRNRPDEVVIADEVVVEALELQLGHARIHLESEGLVPSRRQRALDHLGLLLVLSTLKCEKRVALPQEAGVHFRHTASSDYEDGDALQLTCHRAPGPCGFDGAGARSLCLRGRRLHLHEFR